MLSLEKKTKQVFYRIIIITSLFLVVISSLSLLLYQRLTGLALALSQGLESICGCTAHLSFFDHPLWFSFLGLASLAIVSWLVFAIFKFFSLQIKTARFIKKKLRVKKDKFSPNLRQVARKLKIEKNIVEIEEREPLVFCFSYLKPKICIASALVEKLSKKELEAVLYHEKYHLKKKETIKVFINNLLGSILFFIPGFRALLNHYQLLSELSADKWATESLKTKSYLARAMYKVLDLREGSIIRKNLAIASFSHVSEERVNKIADENYVIKIKGLRKKSFVYILSFCLLVFTVIFFAYSSQRVLASHGANACLSDNHNNHNCQMTDSRCQMNNQTIRGIEGDCFELKNKELNRVFIDQKIFR